MLDWIKAHSTTLAWTGGITVGLLIVGLIAARIAIVQLPEDFFAPERTGRHQPLWVRIGRGVVGFALIIAGLAMLVLPGPGILVLLVGIVLAEFPGREKLLRWIMSRGPVLRAANALRQRKGRPPLRPGAA